MSVSMGRLVFCWSQAQAEGSEMLHVSLKTWPGPCLGCAIDNMIMSVFATRMSDSGFWTPGPEGGIMAWPS